MSPTSFFRQGFKVMLPITTGVIPFGAVVGTVCETAQLSFFQTVTMNTILYAGTSHLAAMDLMTKNAAASVVIFTGLIINLRFLLYSAAMSPVVHKSDLLTKLFCAFSLTDQSYAAMTANQDKFRSSHDAVQFYLGTAVCMMIVWHLSVICGYAFGNFAPASWSLDYAVPLSFIALVIPTLKNKIYIAVAIFSAVVSILLDPLPYRLGLIATALLSIAFGVFLTRKHKKA